MDKSGFYDAGLLKQVAVNLFYGWGYNFYRKENQLRADDQLVRAKAAWLLGLAHSALDGAEQALRRERLPTPTRDKPFPDPAAVADVQAVERLSGQVGQLIARLHSQPAPENDRMTQRYRQEAETLAKLGDCDAQLVGQCDLLRASLEGKDAAWTLANLAPLQAGVTAIEATLQQRQAVLT